MGLTSCDDMLELIRFESAAAQAPGANREAELTPSGFLGDDAGRFALFRTKNTTSV